jgi:hypothetical protein
MKEFEVTVRLPADTQTALRVLYSDGAFFSAYHARVGDCGTRVTDWDPATRTRTVSFQKRLDVPAPIARVLGARPPPSAARSSGGWDPGGVRGACGARARDTPRAARAAPADVKAAPVAAQATSRR